MNTQQATNQNRSWVALNYFSLLAILTLFYAGKFNDWNTIYIVFEVGAILLFLFTLYFAFIKTNFWRLAHSSTSKLDERELQVVLNSLRYSYSIFTVICLSIIYLFAIAEYSPIDVVLAGALLYLAHTLPAAIVGWNEKMVSVEE